MSLPCLRGSGPRSTLRAVTLQTLCASFTTSVAVAAVKKGAKVQVKRKTPVRKGPTSSGPRSSKKRAGGGDASSAVSRTNPFFEPARKMSQLQEFMPESASSAKLYQPMAWTKRTLDATRIQGFGLTREMARQFASVPRPRSVLRPSSLRLFDILDKSAASSSSSPNTLLLGPTGSGLSTLLLQSFSYALESSWIVIYIPRTINLVDSSSPYVYSEVLQTYLQPDIARGILERLLSINETSLSKLTIGGEAVKLDRGLTIEANTNVTLVAREGLKNTASPTATQQILEIVLKRLIQQNDVPVLVAIDGAQALFSTTTYRDADYRQLKSYELAVPRLLQSCLRKSGPGSFGGVQKGKVLTAYSLQHKEWPISDELKSALELENVDPYKKLDPIMHALIQDCEFEKVDFELELTKSEAISLFEVAKEEGQLWHASSDEYFMTKLVESGGNMGVFDRSLRKSAM
ncbi:hypothetical protein CBS101457_003796 [Exobasidium rhododendri]|nr:hypothetical protein CBS101457_003796 [Exobasidium rhododendri]